MREAGEVATRNGTSNADKGQREPVVRSRTGQTRSGNPLALNFAPSPDLEPWFSWLSVTDIELPEGEILHCRMLNDLPCLRIMFGGKWTLQTREGTVELEPGQAGLAMDFGPQTRAMDISVEGKLLVITVQLGPPSLYALGGPPAEGTLDRVFNHDDLAGHGHLASRFDPQAKPEEWLEVFEYELRKFIASLNSPKPEPISLAFDRQCLADPNIAMRDFADQQGVSQRTIERMIKRDFGLAPKQVVRRARALDMASALLGVAMEEDEAKSRLRYFDQSHLIREIKHFFGMTPSQLTPEAHPMLSLSLETRQARRMKALELLQPGEAPPWRDPAAEPNIARSEA